ncbi:MAG: iron-containing alcohol dehydrogenase [Rickettsiales bacterium]|nr:iron-containing alcohol dehydrogenase [Rickettsiales bacterium]
MIFPQLIFGDAKALMTSFNSNFIKADQKILFVSDQKIWQNCQRFFPQKFLDNFTKILILKNPQADWKNLQKIYEASENCNFILALGSGTISDLCKYSSAQKNIPYAIFISAASMNGYLSKNASITISGHKKTLPATLPKAVFCDLKILKSAPLELTKAGIGDSLCFYCCWFDWYLSHRILGSKFDKKPFEILRKKMKFFVKNFAKFSLQDESFLKLLIEILLLSGQGMTIADGSYPASQSEHLIAHTISMKFPKIAAKTLHGQQIAVTSLTVAKLQKKLLDKYSAKFPLSITRSFVSIVEIENFFGKKIAKECAVEFQKKIFSQKKINQINILLQKNWQKIRQDLQKIYFDDKRLKKIFTHFKIKTSPQSLGLSKSQYQDCIMFAKFIRNRFTCLDLFY